MPTGNARKRRKPKATRTHAPCGYLFVRNDWSSPCLCGGPTSSCKYNLWRKRAGWDNMKHMRPHQWHYLWQCCEHSAKQICDSLSCMQAGITPSTRAKTGSGKALAAISSTGPWKVMFSQSVEACCTCLMLQDAVMLHTCTCVHTHACMYLFIWTLFGDSRVGIFSSRP